MELEGGHIIINSTTCPQSSLKPSSIIATPSEYISHLANLTTFNRWTKLWGYQQIKSSKYISNQMFKCDNKKMADWGRDWHPSYYSTLQPTSTLYQPPRCICFKFIDCATKPTVAQPLPSSARKNRLLEYQQHYVLDGDVSNHNQQAIAYSQHLTGVSV